MANHTAQPEEPLPERETITHRVVAEIHRLQPMPTEVYFMTILTKGFVHFTLTPHGFVQVFIAGC